MSNYHVVAGADEIRAVLNDRREFAARVVLADAESDIAILQLDGAEGLPHLTMRDSDSIEVGDLVLAIGNPFGVGQTVSSGIISGTARSGTAAGNLRGYYLQTDAPINPGNSGGALVDTQGQLVGINTAILTRSGGSNGVGFAIPANLVATFVRQAGEGADRFRRPWAGMSGQAVDFALAEGFGLDRPRGMLIDALHDASPFRAAGLLPGDIVVSVDGRPVNAPAEMLFRISVAGPGTSVDIGYIRDGQERGLAVRLAEAPEDPPRETRTIGGSSPLTGLTVARVNPAVIAEMNLGLNEAGVVVMSVEGIAIRAGFAPGDLIRRVNGTTIASPTDAVTAGEANTRRWEIELERGGQTLNMRFSG